MNFVQPFPRHARSRIPGKGEAQARCGGHGFGLAGPGSGHGHGHGHGPGPGMTARHGLPAMPVLARQAASQGVGLLAAALFLAALSCLAVLDATPAFAGGAGGVPCASPQLPAPQSTPSPSHPLDLAQCIALALRNNAGPAAAREGLAIAEAQHRQALSAYWPQLTASSTQTRLDRDPVFVYPQDSFDYTVDMGGGPMTMRTTVPERRIRLADRDIGEFRADLGLLLYDGGRREARVREAVAGHDAAAGEARLTSLQLVHDVTTRYYGVVLARALRDLGRETVQRLEATSAVVEHFYKGGSQRVRKTDWLRAQVGVLGMRSLLAELDSNVELAESALANTLGLPWDGQVRVADTELPATPDPGDLDGSVADAYRLNLDLARFDAGVHAAEARLDDATGEYLPVVSLFGTLSTVTNAYDGGLVAEGERTHGAAGVTVELPLFEGFRTRARVEEMRARLRQLAHQRVLLREGVALRVKDAVLQERRAARQAAIGAQTVAVAAESRALTERAYREGLVDTRELLETQIYESLVRAARLRALYEAQAAAAARNLVAGTEILEHLREVGYGARALP
ncbi:TolC family protein [Nitratidesulfovibrio termitidis]|uniref:TolC family protein n=1 Tax=Nitratidesulfovibrio termitidis TaxID=42252 RepID=UPI001FDFDE43|nr:TolC family protein [Nitratidesulfovibrio termitidis]